MSILNRKRRIKCSVQFTIQELLSVPFINGILFCKLRLVEGGNFTSLSSKKEILHSSVVWNFDINFEVKINTSLLNPDLYEPCICRISVRKEIRGGKSFQKLGYIDYNLSDFINKQEISLNRVLKEYDSKNRLDNSFLKVKIKVNEIPQQLQQQQQSSIAKKSPTVAVATTPLTINTIFKQQKSQMPTSSSITSSSSSSSSPSTIQQQQQHKQDTINLIIDNEQYINKQQCTTTTTTTSISHSRNSSKSSAMSFEKGHHRNVSNSSTTSNNSYDTASTRSKNKKLIEELQSKDANIRIIETRIDAHEIINQVESELANRDLIIGTQATSSDQQKKATKF